MSQRSSAVLEVDSAASKTLTVAFMIILWEGIHLSTNCHGTHQRVMKNSTSTPLVRFHVMLTPY